MLSSSAKAKRLKHERRDVEVSAEASIDDFLDLHEAIGGRAPRAIRLRLLTQLSREVRPACGQPLGFADDGRRQHAELVASAFAPDLDGLDDGARAARAALLETVTDVYTWTLLRRRGGLGRKATEAAILGLVNHARGADPR